MSRNFAVPAQKKKKGTPTKKKDSGKAQKQGQRTIEMAPSGRDDAYAFYKGIVDAPKLKRPKLDPETYAKHAEIAKTYTRKTQAEHMIHMGQLQLKLDLQQFAIRSLPHDMRAHASQYHDAPLPPPDRRWLCWTPPIPGFNATDYIIEDDDDGDASVSRSDFRAE